MRTRTSWRNQNILWRALGNVASDTAAQVPKRDDVAMYERLLARTDINPRDRRAFERSLRAAKVRRALRAPHVMSVREIGTP